MSADGAEVEMKQAPIAGWGSRLSIHLPDRCPTGREAINGAVLVGTAVISARLANFVANKLFGTKPGGALPQRAKQALEVPAKVGGKPPQPFLTACRKHKQEQLLSDWPDLSETERRELLAEIQALDMERLSRVFTTSTTVTTAKQGLPEPVQNVKKRSDIKPLEQTRWMNLGYALIAQGKLAIIVMAGGQGTRLGSSAPKGCFDIGLPSKKPLFQLHMERIRRVQQLAASAYYNSPRVVHKVHVYIMTSPMTHEPTREHFERHRFFGLDPEQVHMFQQGTMPCVDSAGRVIMETPSKVARSPNGNGGIYTALADSGCLDHMKIHGVQCVDVLCIDNALAKVADPMFSGYCWEAGAELGCRTLAKAHPMEKVGVFVKDSDGIGVCEYSEMPAAELGEVDPASGLLKYNWSNICMHYFSVPFLSEVAASMATSAQYHVAHKKIPSKDGDVQGIKLEQFIFDPFPHARRTALLEVDRAAEFAPVKNAPNEDKPDSPETARDAVLKLHKSWVEAAGGTVKITKGEGLEISPLVSYGGEGLEHLCRRQVFKSMRDTTLQGLAPVQVYKAAAAKAAAYASQLTPRSGATTPREENPLEKIGTFFKRTMSSAN